MPITPKEALAKDFLKTVSSMIHDLASDLRHYVEDEEDAVAKDAFSERIVRAEAMVEQLDAMIFELAKAQMSQ